MCRSVPSVAETECGSEAPLPPPPPLPALSPVALLGDVPSNGRVTKAEMELEVGLVRGGFVVLDGCGIVRPDAVYEAADNTPFDVDVDVVTACVARMGKGSAVWCGKGTGSRIGTKETSTLALLEATRTWKSCMRSSQRRFTRRRSSRKCL